MNWFNEIANKLVRVKQSLESVGERNVSKCEILTNTFELVNVNSETESISDSIQSSVISFQIWCEVKQK